MKMDTNFEDLGKDRKIVTQLQQVNDSVNKIEEMLKLIKNPETYEELSTSDKVNYNLLMSFSLNSLFWMYLRLEGVDPKGKRIMAENERLKKAMIRVKEINNEKNRKIHLNKETAQRFIRSSLWQPKTSMTSREEEKTWDCP